MPRTAAANNLEMLLAAAVRGVGIAYGASFVFDAYIYAVFPTEAGGVAKVAGIARQRFYGGVGPCALFRHGLTVAA